MSNEYVFVMSKEYAEKNNVEIKDITDLKKYSLILPKDGTSAKKILDEYIGNEKVEPHYEMISERMRLDLAREGVGIAYVIKRIVEKEIETGELIKVELNKTSNVSKVGLAIQKEEISSFATKKLVEYIMDYNKQ